MTVLGVDLSSFAIDVVELGDDNSAEHHRYDLGSGDILDRIRRVHYVMPHRDTWEQAEAIGMERPAAKFGAWQVSMAFGAVLQCLPYGVLVEWLVSTTWKKELLGSGKASKMDALAWVGDNWWNHPMPLTEDAADAYCVARTIRNRIVTGAG